MLLLPYVDNVNTIPTVPIVVLPTLQKVVIIRTTLFWRHYPYLNPVTRIIIGKEGGLVSQQILSKLRYETLCTAHIIVPTHLSAGFLVGLGSQNGDH